MAVTEGRVESIRAAQLRAMVKLQVHVVFVQAADCVVFCLEGVDEWLVWCRVCPTFEVAYSEAVQLALIPSTCVDRVKEFGLCAERPVLVADWTFCSKDVLRHFIQWEAAKAVA